MGFIKRAPLPFIGNKGNAIKFLIDDFKDIDLKDYTIVDVFGGSGILSDFFKKSFPTNEVIWNDYDNYYERFLNIDKTNEQINYIREMLANKGVKFHKSIPKDIKGDILKFLKGQTYTDSHTLVSNLAYHGGMTGKQLKEITLYNKVRSSDYYRPLGYLDGVKRIRKDFRDIKVSNNGFYVIDTPYVATIYGQYKGNSFTLRDFIEVLERFSKGSGMIVFYDIGGVIDNFMDYAYEIRNRFNTVIRSEPINAIGAQRKEGYTIFLK